MIKKLIKKQFINFKPYTSARNLYTTGTFFDANESPFETGLNRYPNPSYLKLREMLADYVGSKSENIFIGVGSNEVLDLIVRLFVEPEEEVVIFTPTYGMYEVIASKNGVKSVKIPLNNNFQINKQGFRKSVTPKTKLVFICSPNSPTGNLIKKEDILEICENFKGIVVVDEAYIEYAKTESLANTYPNLIVVRTLSKAWGLAGIRVGYAVASSEIVNYLEMIKFPYNLNILSETAAIKSLKNQARMEQQVDIILRGKKTMIKALKRLKLSVYDSDANFILLKHDNPEELVAKLAQDYEVIVRAFDKYIRITIGLPGQNQKLIKALTEIL